MAENFVREFEKLNGADVMGIYGAAHTGLEAMDMPTNTVPCMASQLKKRYGTSIDSEDLSLLTRITEPVDTGKFTINGKEYTASYFGKQDISAFAPDYQYREFWRLEDAYEDFKDLPVSGDVLPYSNYPMAIEDGQIFVIDYTKADNSVIRMYYRSNGSIWNGLPSTEGFILK